MNNLVKLNIGSHNKIIEGDYINLDGLDLENVDAVCDLSEAPYRLDVKDIEVFKNSIQKKEEDKVYFFANDSIDKIKAIEFLEHISFHKTHNVLKEWYRILKDGGIVEIQVPDCGKAMEYYMNNQICECVSHKPQILDEAKADPKCFICGGGGKIHPNRWLYSFLGAQKHKYDAHLNIFTKERLESVLQQVGFKNIQFQEDEYGWKLKVKCRK